MIGKVGAGWQTTTADLALILFLVVSTAAIDRDPAPQSPIFPDAKMAAMPVAATPSTAVYRATAETSFPEWLRAQVEDNRLVATVIVTRAASNPSPKGLDEAIALLDQIEASGRQGRLLIERGPVDDVVVVLAYDIQTGDGMTLASK